MASTRLFLPGFGAGAGLYRQGLPPGWSTLDPPRFGRGGGSFRFRTEWLLGELAALGGGATLAGHSMGAALAIAAAAGRPELVESLVLIAPAGLPLSKPVRRSLHDLGGQVVHRRYPFGELGRSTARMARSPRSAARLARELRRLDLRGEMGRVRAAGIPSTVVACATDTLTTAAHCRAIAAGLGARYRELPFAGGHMWMLTRWREFSQQLSAA